MKRLATIEIGCGNNGFNVVAHLGEEDTNLFGAKALYATREAYIAATREEVLERVKTLLAQETLGEHMEAEKA